MLPPIFKLCVMIPMMAEDADAHWMRRALQAASEAQGRGEVPVGACVIVRMPCSRSLESHAHGLRPNGKPEMIACAKRPKSWKLQADGRDHLFNFEPCAMCAGALIQPCSASCLRRN